MEESCKKEFEKEIEAELEKECCCKNNNKNYVCKSGNSCIYGLGVIGAAIFFLAKATTFWAGALAILKALVWPALMVYELFKFLIK